jgi:hypothetical protein
VYPTADPNTTIVESSGGGDTADGGRYTQRYFTLFTIRNGQAFRKERWEHAVGEIAAMHNRPWPASQLLDPIVLPPLK